MQRQHHTPAGDDRGHQALHLRAVADDAVGRAVEQRERPARSRLPDVGPEAEHRVEGRRLVQGRGLVGEPPEEQREHDVAPQLRRAVEQRERPVADHADEPRQASRQGRGGAGGLLAEVERVVVGVGAAEGRIKGQEGPQHGVEERLAGQPLRRGAVGEQEEKGAGPDCVDREEGDHVRPAATGGDDERVGEGVEDGVVEGHEEEAVAFVLLFLLR